MPDPTLPSVGRASWYGGSFIGRRLAGGGLYHADGIFVANRSYPFHTKLRIVNLVNHRVIVAPVEDRGPYVPGRSLDLSERAADQLGMKRRGVVPVSYQVVE